MNSLLSVYIYIAICIQKNRDINMGTVSDFIFLGSKITADGDYAMKLKDAYSLEGKL